MKWVIRIPPSMVAAARETDHEGEYVLADAACHRSRAGVLNSRPFTSQLVTELGL